MHYIGIDNSFVNEEIGHEIECISEILERKGYTLLTNQKKSRFIDGCNKRMLKVRHGDTVEEYKGGQELIGYVNKTYDEELPHIAQMSDYSRNNILSAIALFKYNPNFVVVSVAYGKFSTNAKYVIAEAERRGVKIYNIFFQKEFDELQELLWSKTM